MSRPWEPTAKQIAILSEREVILTELSLDRAFLKQSPDADFETDRVLARIDVNLGRLEKLPTIEVMVRVVMSIDGERQDEMRIVCTSRDYMAEGISRAMALNKLWVHYVSQGTGSIQAWVEETYEARPMAELNSIAKGGI